MHTVNRETRIALLIQRIIVHSNHTNGQILTRELEQYHPISTMITTKMNQPYNQLLILQQSEEQKAECTSNATEEQVTRYNAANTQTSRNISENNKIASQTTH